MRRITLSLVVCALLVLVALVSSETSLATAPSGSSAGFTYRATLPALHSNSSDYKIDQKNPQDVVMRELTIAPGGSSGWHFHPGPTYVIVAAGTGSLYEATDPTCTAHNYGAGQGFVELGGDVHDLRNQGTSDLVLYITFTDVPVGGVFRLDAPAPGNCPF